MQLFEYSTLYFGEHSDINKTSNWWKTENRRDCLIKTSGGLIGLMKTKQTDVFESVISAVGLGWPNDGHQLPGPYHGDFGQHQTSKTIISGSTLPHAMWQLTEDVLLTQINVGWETSIANHQKTHCRMLGGRKKPAKILSLRIGLVEKNRTPNSFFVTPKMLLTDSVDLDSTISKSLYPWQHEPIWSQTCYEEVCMLPGGYFDCNGFCYQRAQYKWYQPRDHVYD